MDLRAVEQLLPQLERLRDPMVVWWAVDDLAIVVPGLDFDSVVGRYFDQVDCCHY